MKKTCLIILSVILIYSLNSYSYGGHRSAKWWKDSEVAKEIHLTKDQIDLIEQIFNSDKEQIVDLNSKLKIKQSNLRSKLEDPNSSRDEVLELNDEVVQLKTKLKRLRLDMLLKIRDVLTPEQRQKLQEIRIKGMKKKVN